MKKDVYIIVGKGMLTDLFYDTYLSNFLIFKGEIARSHRIKAI